MRFESCSVELRSSTGDVPDFSGDDCDVTLEAGSITVAYFDDEGPVVFGGREASPGRFELVCRSRPRVATLERRGQAFEGSWEEQESRGSWRIVLPPDFVG